MLETLSMFGFRAMWSPWFLFLTVSSIILYVLLIKGFLVKKSSVSNSVTKKQIISFITALVLLYTVKGSPIDLLGHLNFSIHMVQMSILYLVLPPLFIIGTPKWIFRKLFNSKPIERVFLFLTKPLFALILFNGLFSLYHFPFIFDYVKTNSIIHIVVTVLLFISAFIMWWPLVCPLSEYRKLSSLQKLAYIFADGVLLTPACALIIFADTPLFSTYSDSAVLAKALELCIPSSMISNMDLSNQQMFSWLSPLNDQQLGGIIMKIMQEVVYGITLGYVFFQWVKEEKQKDQEEELSIPSPQPLK